MHCLRGNGLIEEIYKTDGIEFVKNKIEKGFISILRYAFGEFIVDGCLKNFPVDMNDLMKEFHRRMQGRFQGRETFTIRTPECIREKLEGSSGCKNDDIRVTGDLLLIKPVFLIKRLETPINEVIMQLRGILSHGVTNDVDSLYLIGSLSENILFKEAMIAEFQQTFKVIIVENPSSIVAEGAINYGIYRSKYNKKEAI